MAVRILVGDARDRLATLPAASVQCCVTSPPYFGLRDYGAAGQIGLEPTQEDYVAALVAVFRDVRRVLADDGVLWVVIGDSYSGGGGFSPDAPSNRAGSKQTTQGSRMYKGRKPAPGYKPKDLLMIPARVALALQADGWYLRSHCIWAKPNPMPESVRDRPTSAHESVFLLTKRARYFYDANAVAEPAAYADSGRQSRKRGEFQGKGCAMPGREPCRAITQTRNLRNVWNIAPRNFRGAHFATFPVELARRCILAGSRPGDTVLDPFFGAGTTGVAAQELGRDCVGIELNPDYAALAEQRIAATGALLAGLCEAAD